MLDSNGSTTTAAAGVALVAKAAGSLQGKSAVVLAGTGPVGMRSAALLAGEGADVTIAGRALDKTQAAADAINKRFKVSVKAAATPDEASRVALVKGKNLIFTAGAIGVELLPEAAWAQDPAVEIVADYNAQPPTGIGGIDVMDKGKDRNGKKAFGALGIGGLKLKLHRACVGQLFESTEQVLDAEEIYALAKSMA
jgi:threonine dehydrogenase-like Zn-dependent dehydrogenase